MVGWVDWVCVDREGEAREAASNTAGRLYTHSWTAAIVQKPRCGVCMCLGGRMGVKIGHAAVANLP